MQNKNKFYKTEKGHCYHKFSCVIIKHKMIDEYYLIEEKDIDNLKACKLCINPKKKIYQTQKNCQNSKIPLEESIMDLQQKINFINKVLKSLSITSFFDEKE